MKTRLLVLPILVAAFAGCADDRTGPSGDDDSAGAMIIAGSYDTESVWDLTSALSPDALGDALAGVLVDNVAAALGVPSVLERQAKAAVQQAIGAQLASLIAEHAPESAFGVKLSQVLADARLESVLSIDEAGAGRQRVRTVEFRLDNRAANIALGIADVTGEFTGRRLSADRVVIEEHALSLRLASTLEPALRTLLGDGTASSLYRAAAAVVSCQDIAFELAGDDGFTVGVAGVGYSLSTEDIASVCDAAAAELGEQLIALLRIETGLACGGGLVFGDNDGNNRADDFASDETFAGTVTTPFVPLALAVEVLMTGDRE